MLRDVAVIKPVAKAYRAAVPGIIRTGVSNFFSNLEDVWISVNDVLQGKFQQGLEDFGRVLFNSTWGIAGIFDAASDVGMQKHNEDFGQTLGRWGFGSGSISGSADPRSVHHPRRFRTAARHARRSRIPDRRSSRAQLALCDARNQQSDQPPRCFERDRLGPRSTNIRSFVMPGCSAAATLSTTEIRRGEQEDTR